MFILPVYFITKSCSTFTCMLCNHVRTLAHGYAEDLVSNCNSERALLAAGSSGPPIVLVHGFGASAYHWRYNIIELAKKHRVFAVDLLGFGWSDKALVDYSSNIWSDQIAAFIREVVNDGPVVLAGNSLGGYNSLATAARYPELVK